MNKSNVTELVFGCVVVQYWLVVLPPPHKHIATERDWFRGTNQGLLWDS